MHSVLAAPVCSAQEEGIFCQTCFDEVEDVADLDHCDNCETCAESLTNQGCYGPSEES